MDNRHALKKREKKEDANEVVSGSHERCTRKNRTRDVSFTLESGLSTDEILRKSDSSSAIVWDEFESEKISTRQSEFIQTTTTTTRRWTK